MQRTCAIHELPVELRVEDAVEAGCARDLAVIEDALLAGRSVLVACDRDLVLPLCGVLRDRLQRALIDVQTVDGRGEPNDAFARQLARLSLIHI